MDQQYGFARAGTYYGRTMNEVTRGSNGGMQYDLLYRRQVVAFDSANFLLEEMVL